MPGSAGDASATTAQDDHDAITAAVLALLLLLRERLRRAPHPQVQAVIRTTLTDAIPAIAAAVAASIADNFGVPPPDTQQLTADLHTAMLPYLADPTHAYLTGPTDALLEALLAKAAVVAHSETQRVVVGQSRAAAADVDHLTRSIGSSHPCKQCESLAGEYDAPFPSDVWFTHPGCACRWSISKGSMKMAQAKAQPALKFADKSRTALSIRLIPFGGSINGRDMAKEYFSAKSDLCLDWYPDRRPLLYHHGLDAAVKVTPIGYIEGVEVKADGAWARAQLDAHNEYYGEICGLIDQDALGASSGAMSHLVKVNSKTGHIDRWPLVEGSLTPTPCEPLLATVDFETAKAHFKSAGLDTDALKAVWSAKQQDALPDSAFLYVETGGEQDDEGKTTPRSLRHFPVRDAEGKLDEAHVRNALARIPQSTLLAAVKARAQAKAQKYAKSLGIDAQTDAGAKSGGFVVPTGLLAAGPEIRRLAAKAGPTQGVCAQCMLDNEAGCRCGPCIDGDAAGCLCDLATYGATVEEPAPEPPAVTLDGCFEDRIQDVREAVNQSGPMARYSYNEVLATFETYVVVCRHDWSDDGPGDQTYWRIPYSMADDTPVLDVAHAEHLQQVYLPTAAKSVTLALSLDAHALSTHATALTTRTKDVSAARLKEGRVLSAANRTQIAAAIKTLADATTALQDLLDATDRTQVEAAKAAALASPEARARLLTLLGLST